MAALNLSKSRFFALAMFLVIAITACSRLDWAISFAPRMIAGKIDDAFDFSSQKNQKIKESIERTLSAQKKIAGEDLAQIVSELETEAKRGLMLIGIKKIFDRIATWQRTLLKNFSGTIELVVNPLSESELSYYQKYHQKKFHQAQEEISEDTDLDKEIYEKYETFFEFFVDDIRPNQKTLILNFIQSHRAYYRSQVQHRREFTERFVEFSEQQKPLKDLVLSQFLIPNFDSLEPLEKKIFIEESMVLCSEFWSRTSEEQKNYFFKQLKFYRKMLLEL